MSIHATRIEYIKAIAKMQHILDVEMQGVRDRKLAPSSAELFYEAGQDLLKARVKYSQAITLEGMLKHE